MVIAVINKVQRWTDAETTDVSSARAESAEVGQTEAAGPTPELASVWNTASSCAGPLAAEPAPHQPLLTPIRLRRNRPQIPLGQFAGGLKKQYRFLNFRR